MNMKSLCVVMMALLAGEYVKAQVEISPSVKTKTTFAIVVDQKSYEAAKLEIEAYRNSVERDGLGTYLLVDDWKRPEPIREKLKELHERDKAPLEGCVFVGDIPIPMIRDAHHLSSAFKMSPKANWQRSSIPSDRYYDDFGLNFDYLKQDSLLPDYHYLSLRADSKQYISPDIYSARIRPLRLEGKDRYQMLRDYLKKVVSEKNRVNVLDQLTMARGHGYNSEDRLAWSGEQLALREQLPSVFRPEGTVKFYDFDIRYPAKSLYLNEIQREGLDVMLFHHHGGPTMQYLNGYENGSGIDLSIKNIKLFLRSKVFSYAQKHGRDKAVQKYSTQYGVPESWCEEAFDEDKIKADSILNRNMDIYTDDIHQLTPNARFVLFDACFNGSFHQDDNIDGAYIYNKGKTICTMGCTVNTVQDKWPDEFLGLLAAGMRIGQFTRFTCYLENHLIGDPTFHFTNSSSLNMDINHCLVLKEGKAGFWKNQLHSSLPDMQAMALRQLSMLDLKDLPVLLNRIYRESSYFVVRLEALRLLALNYPNEAVEVLKLAMNDSYELIRRFAVDYVEKNANPAFIPAWLENYLLRGYENRYHFRFLNSLSAFDYEAALAELKVLTASEVFYDTYYVDELFSLFPLQHQRLVRDLGVMSNPDSKPKYIRQEMNAFRNNPVSMAIKPLLDVLKDESKSEELRVAAAETLGWYNLYYRKSDIIEALQTFSTSNSAVMKEVNKTIHRLKSKNR